MLRNVRALQIVLSALRRHRRTLVLSIILGIILLEVANTPYSLLHSLVHCQCVLRATADDINRVRSERAMEYFHLWNSSRQYSDLQPDTQNEEKTVGAKVEKHRGSSPVGTPEGTVKTRTKNSDRSSLKEDLASFVGNGLKNSSRQYLAGNNGVNKKEKLRPHSKVSLQKKIGSISRNSFGQRNISSFRIILGNTGRDGLKQYSSTVLDRTPGSTMSLRQYNDSSLKNSPGSSSTYYGGRPNNARSLKKLPENPKEFTQRSTVSLKREHSSQKRVRVAIAIVTMRRRSPFSLGYVIQSAAALHSLLRQQKHGDLFADSFLFVCNVDSSPERHADAVFLEKYIPVLNRYGESSHSAFISPSKMIIPGKKKLTYHEVIHNNVYDKERVDYVFCLESALHLHPEYVLVVEDDAVALPDMPSVVQRALDRIVTKHHKPRHKTTSDLVSSHRNDPNTSFQEPRGSRGINQRRSTLIGKSSQEQSECISGFVYLKLYFPLYWQGFAFEFYRLLDLVCMTAVLTPLVVCCLRACFHMTRRRVYLQQLVHISFIFSLAACILLGRQNVNELRRVSKDFYRLQTSPECCTPAVLYPSDIVPSLVEWLSTCKSQKHVDLCIAEFVNHTGLATFNIEPNLFVHIGTVTSLTMGNKDAEEVLFYRDTLLFQL